MTSLLHLQVTLLYANTCVPWWDQYLPRRMLQIMQQPFTCPSFGSKRTSGMSLPLYINCIADDFLICLHLLQLYICFPICLFASMTRNLMIHCCMPGETVRVQQPFKACCFGHGRTLASWLHASADGPHSCAEGVPRYNIFPSASARILPFSTCCLHATAHWLHATPVLRNSRSCIAMHVWCMTWRHA